MIEFYELKNQIINELSQFIEQTESSSSTYLTYKTEVSIKQIAELIPFLKDMTTCYFKTPGGSETLGLGELEFFNSLMDLEKIDVLANENSELDFLGALPFNSFNKLDNEWGDFEGHNLFLPKFTLCKTKGRTFFKVNIKKDTKERSILKMNVLTEVESLFSFIHRDLNRYKVVSEEYTTSKDSWSSMINKSIGDFKNSALEKVVLARTKKVNYEKKVDAHRLFLDLKNDNNIYEFFFHIAHGASFLSFTPEKLYQLKENKVTIDSIAGTLKNTDACDGSKLLNSEKDLEEHRIVSRYIETNLESIGARVTKTTNEKLLCLPKLFHIHSKYEGTFDKSISNYQLLNHLHPTPAVGGFPKTMAIDFIQENELINRGFYAGPIGHISASVSEFAVGIRSILVNGDDVHFYGGAGIVEDSTPENEWIETGDKIESVQCMM